MLRKEMSVNLFLKQKTKNKTHIFTKSISINSFFLTWKFYVRYSSSTGQAQWYTPPSLKTQKWLSTEMNQV